MSLSRATKGVISTPATTSSTGVGYGTITIDPMCWQLITIPIQYGYFNTSTGVLTHDGSTTATIKNYVMDQIEYIKGSSVKNYIEVANCYFGDENKFRSYIPGVTNPSSSQNFPLARVSPTLEYTAFWVKSICSTSIQISWGSQNG